MLAALQLARGHSHAEEASNLFADDVVCFDLLGHCQTQIVRNGTVVRIGKE